MRREPSEAEAQALNEGPPPIVNRSTPAIVDENPVPKHWLYERISVEQAEAEHMSGGVPFGGLNAK